MKRLFMAFLYAAVCVFAMNNLVAQTTYRIVDTGQDLYYNASSSVSAPSSGAAFYGQDAHYAGNQPSYTVSGDVLTVYDNNTGLTWTQSPDLDNAGNIDSEDKLTWSELQSYPDTINATSFGGYNDWRVPTIKELYSLMDFRGTDPSGYEGTDTSGLVPYIDTNYFAFGFGDTVSGERLIDAQYWSGTEYVSTTMGGDATVFGVNFADGRIKGYPRDTGAGGSPFTQYARFVRGNTSYGINNFTDNNDGTVTDLATGLMWQKSDSGAGYNWENALSYSEALKVAVYDDWRLPNAKELQSILDYSRSLDTTGSAAIDSVFNATVIVDEGGNANYPFYWTGTTHANWNQESGGWGVYISFGEALGYMNDAWIDVHGAGAQRSDPKYDDGTDYSAGHGPQGDAVRINNYVRCVRDVRAGESHSWGFSGAESVSGDYNGDGNDDLGIYDSNTGYWYVLSAEGSLITWAQQWGWAGAETVPGNYDGDDKDDFSVYDNNSGYWYVLSPKGSLITWAQQWGWAGAGIVSGDYNGDGQDDFAVYDSANGYWYILSADGELIAWAVQWGWAGAETVPGDYDGDGQDDLAVYDDASGSWYIQSLSGELIAWAVQWGWAGAETVPGDYDGDGQDDLAVYDASSGGWYILSLNGPILAWGTQWGFSGAEPVSGDYNGDGISDIVVYSEQAGRWYLY